MAVKSLQIPGAVWRMASSCQERKNESFKLCFLGHKIFIISFDHFQFTSLFGSDIAVNSVMKSRKPLFHTFVNKKVQCQRKHPQGFLKVYSVWLKRICRRHPRQQKPTEYWKT